MTGKAYFLDATQTPSGLSKKEYTKYSRTDFYLEQIVDCLKSLPTIVYYVADGFYAKDKIINGLTSNGKHLITKLRLDANLKYLNDKPRLKGQRGASRKYDGKVNFKKNGIPPSGVNPIVFQTSLNGYWWGLMKNILI